MSAALEAALIDVNLRIELANSLPPGGGGTEFAINSACLKDLRRKGKRSEPCGTSDQSRGCRDMRASWSIDMLDNDLPVVG